MAASVGESPGGASVRDGWADVRRRHRARNSAQHEGLGADCEDLAAWAAATGSIVASLARAVFGVELSAARLSAAVADRVRRPRWARAVSPIQWDERGG